MARLQLDDKSLKSLLDAFYAGVRRDGGPGWICDDAIHGWPDRLVKLSPFRSSAMLAYGRRKG